eukprot:15455292-Alexandrium_andersonii.AAC.1
MANGHAGSCRAWGGAAPAVAAPPLAVPPPVQLYVGTATCGVGRGALRCSPRPRCPGVWCLTTLYMRRGTGELRCNPRGGPAVRPPAVAGALRCNPASRVCCGAALGQPSPQPHAYPAGVRLRATVRHHLPCVVCGCRRVAAQPCPPGVLRGGPGLSPCAPAWRGGAALYVRAGPAPPRLPVPCPWLPLCPGLVRGLLRQVWHGRWRGAGVWNIRRTGWR